jgi:hypothetical protein
MRNLYRISKHVSLSIRFFENRALLEMWKKNVVGQATDDNMAHAHCMLDT